MEVLTEEQYLALNGASRLGIGDSALHKNKGQNSDKTWSKIVNAQAEKDRELLKRREQLREEYRLKIEAGELRQPTRLERLQLKAAGHPDREDVQAAKRLLAKYYRL